MDRKKDIGKVFQERLVDLQQSPRENLWDAISSEMDQSTKRRLLPFWYYIGAGLIGTLALGLFFWSPWENTITKTEPITTVSGREDTSNTKTTNPSQEFVNSNANQNQETAKTANNPVATPLKDKQTAQSRYQSTTTSKTTVVTNKDKIAHNSSKKNTNSSVTSSSPTVNSSGTIVTNINLGEKSSFDTSNSNTVARKLDQESIGTIKENSRKTSKNPKVQKSPEELEALARYQAKIKKELQEAIKTQLAYNEEQYQEQLKKDALAAASSKTQEQDITATTAIEKTAKAPKIALTDEERSLKRQAATEYKVAFTPYTSLLTYGSLVRGSSIDDRLVNNPREALSTVGYGFRIDYPLSKKSSLRFGVGTAPLRYRTENFQVSSVNGNINIFQLTAINTQDINQPSIESTEQAQNFFDQNQVVSIEQDISYLEVPVDYQYRLLNKRVGLSFNSGLSLFVLTNNAVFATADNGNSILVGRETALRDLSFALNLGLSAHYNFSKRWRFNAEPAFKYQINPYTDTTTNFRPYYLGMQFGLSFKY